ncbi:Alpha/Beta hydrolase protein [Mycena metata]|uniref:Alpha/Beta hydrolase protein n=1 Tax=Mycena metata TaxID=1033252 RepID=A0AAD7K1F0_9AGAR|nr:Alpha/Beta hydrolase protein [Mycena metata]
MVLAPLTPLRPPLTRLCTLDSQYAVKDHITQVQDGEIGIHAISPAPVGTENPGFPVLVWFHGGVRKSGWISSSLELDDFQLRILSVELRPTILNVNYRLAPEHPFPAGLEDCYVALKWTILNGKDIGATLAKGFIVGGKSAGGNLAAVVAHRARTDPFPKNMPMSRTFTGSHQSHEDPYANQLLSYEQNSNAWILGKAAILHIIPCNSTELVMRADSLRGNPHDPDLSPLLADHKDLCPVYIKICGLDPLRDEGLL